MGDYVNEERAEAAEIVVGHYALKNEPLDGLDGQHILTELLCDLLHYATKYGIPWGKCQGAARAKWADEVKPKRQGKSHELDTTDMRAVTQEGRVFLPCIHGKMHNEACIECHQIMQAQFGARPWWKRLFGR